MTCEKRDQDLLLLAHGELSFWHRLLVRTHLGHCASCRQRLKRLMTASTALSTVLQPPGGTPWSPASPRPAFPMRLPTLLLFISLGIISLFLCRAVFNVTVAPRHNVAQRPQPPRSPASSSGCRPDLSNDHCQ